MITRNITGLTKAHQLRDWPALMEQAKAMQDTGYTRREIAKTLGVSTTTLRKHLGRADPYRGLPHPEYQRDLVLEMHWRGLSLGQIAYRTGLAKSTCHQWISAAEHS